MRIVSFGGGVNSTALLLGMHERGERPDFILFADTKGEKPETYQHVNLMRNWCVDVGFPEIQTVAYYESRHPSLEQECLNNDTLPSKAFGFGGCSVKWKRQPMDRWIKESPECQAVLASGQKIDRLIGIHAGEVRRGKIPDDDKFHYVYPLREWDWNQRDCEAVHGRYGIKVPCKSACFFCPAMRKAEVIELAESHPDLFERAVEIEDNAILNGTLETVEGLGRHWRWSALVAANSQQRQFAFQDNQAPLCDVCMDQ